MYDVIFMTADCRGVIKLTPKMLEDACRAIYKSYTGDNFSDLIHCIIFSTDNGSSLLISKGDRPTFTEITDSGFIYPFQYMPLFDKRTLEFHGCVTCDSDEPVSYPTSTGKSILEKDIRDYWVVVLVHDAKDVDMSALEVKT